MITFVGGGRFGNAATPGSFPDSADGGPKNRYAAGTFIIGAGCPSLARCLPVFGDFNRDNVINEADFEILAANLGVHLDRDVSHEDGDLDFNRTVDLDDFGIFKRDFPGVVAAATGVPEPATLGLVVLTLSGLFFSGRQRHPRKR